ncbi:MAG: ABC transporter permease [Chloroflexi bacterium]|nr:ABC transporter permease [Chloroflexota bacterium]
MIKGRDDQAVIPVGVSGLFLRRWLGHLWRRLGDPCLALGRLLMGSRLAALGTIITLLFVFMAVSAPWIAPYPPLETNLAYRLQPPSFAHPLGMDDVGRDILSRIIFGSRVSLLIGLSATSIGMMIGVAAGLLAGYYGGRLDILIMRAVEVLLTIPTIVLAIAIVSALGMGATNVIIAVGLTAIPGFARLTRSVVLTVKNFDFVLAARTIGASDARLLLAHLLPNCTAPIIVQTSLGIGSAILIAAALSFLGLGVQPPEPEWGSMLSRGRTYVSIAPHLVAFPGIAIALLVLGFNLLGDGLRDITDPRLRHLAR